MLAIPLLQAGAGVFGATLVFFLLFAFLGLVLTAVSIYAVYWTYKDAQRRRMDSPELWALVVFFGNVPGFIAYLLVRE